MNFNKIPPESVLQRMATSTAAANNHCQYCSDLLKGLLAMKEKCQKCRPGNFKNCDDCDPMWMSYRFLGSNHSCTKKINRRTVAPTGPEYDGVKPDPAHMEQVVKLLQETFPEKSKENRCHLGAMQLE